MGKYRRVTQNAFVQGQQTNRLLVAKKPRRCGSIFSRLFRSD
jgi:hypothetical protein